MHIRMVIGHILQLGQRPSHQADNHIPLGGSYLYERQNASLAYESYRNVGDGDVTLLPSKETQIKFMGDAFYVACTATGKNVQRVMWTGPDGNQITNYDARIHVEDGSAGHKGVDLLFRSILKKDKGRYTCSANVDGKEVEAFFELVVYKPVNFSGTPKEQFLEEGKDSTLICNVDGEPTPTLAWKLEGKSIAKMVAEDKIEIHPDNADWIVVKNVTLKDKGNYSCSATQLTQQTSSFQTFNIDVTVHHKPMASHNNVDESHGYVTGVVNLTCEAVAEPHANFTWLKDNVVMKPSENIKIFNEDHRSVIQLNVINEDMFGDYDCQAENRLGIMRRVITLKKGEKPPVPKTKITEIMSDAFRLSFVTEHNPRMPVNGYKVEYKKSGENWSNATIREFQEGKPYILDGLESATIYVVRASARNVAGYSDHSEDLVQKTKKQHPVNDQLSGVGCYLLSPLCFTTTLLLVLCSSRVGRAVS